MKDQNDNHEGEGSKDARQMEVDSPPTATGAAIGDHQDGTLNDAAQPTPSTASAADASVSSEPIDAKSGTAHHSLSAKHQPPLPGNLLKLSRDTTLDGTLLPDRMPRQAASDILRPLRRPENGRGKAVLPADQRQQHRPPLSCQGG